MPWSETCPMEERARFVLEAMEGWTSMSELCRQYGISRRIGYKWMARYQAEGLAALEDRRRVRRTQALQTPPEVVTAIIELRQKHPTWGPRKLRSRLFEIAPDVTWPAASTIGVILRREGLSQRRRRKRSRSGAWMGTRTAADAPNRVWTADFKGEFRLGCGQLCYPLTIVDAHTRYVLACHGLPSTSTAGARATFERVFRSFGLPEVIRTDNGAPFSSRALGGLSQLAVWWLRLGIRLERIRPRHPQDNGAHERMHRTLKAEATRPTRMTPQLQQRAFDAFRRVYNEERPHEALGQRPPAHYYLQSERRMPRRLPELHYPEDFQRRRVLRHGQIKWRSHQYFVSETLRRQTVGLRLNQAGWWDLFFGPVHLAQLDEAQGVLKPADRQLKARKGHG